MFYLRLAPQVGRGRINSIMFKPGDLIDVTVRNDSHIVLWSTSPSAYDNSNFSVAPARSIFTVISSVLSPAKGDEWLFITGPATGWLICSYYDIEKLNIHV
jgi:hypothetical protein